MTEIDTMIKDADQTVTVNCQAGIAAMKLIVDQTVFLYVVTDEE